MNHETQINVNDDLSYIMRDNPYTYRYRTSNGLKHGTFDKIGQNCDGCYAIQHTVDGEYLQDQLTGTYEMIYTNIHDYDCCLCGHHLDITASATLLFDQDRVVSCLMWYNDAPVKQMTDGHFSDLLPLLLLTEKHKQQIITLFNDQTLNSI